MSSRAGNKLVWLKILVDYNGKSVFPVPWKQVRSKFTCLSMKEISINKIKNYWRLTIILGDISDG